MDMDIIFMFLSAESNFLSHNYLINLIDEYLINHFFEYPILVELSLSDSREKFIEVISNSKIDKSKIDFNNLLLGFVIIAFNNNRLSLANYKKILLEIFDTQHMNFSIEDINLFFENDEVVYTGIGKFFLECEQKAKEFICDFQKKYNKNFLAHYN